MTTTGRPFLQAVGPEDTLEDLDERARASIYTHQVLTYGPDAEDLPPLPQAPLPPAREILADAQEVLGDRMDVHGNPERTLGRTADLWMAYLDRPLSATDVAVMMALLKVARAEHNPDHRDNWVDAAAYVAMAGEEATA